MRRVEATLYRSHQVTVCSLTGMRGIGKTQLAAAVFRDRVRSRQAGVALWIDADTELGVTLGIDRLAARLGVLDPSGDFEKTVHNVREHLAARRGRHLMVFDNATDPVRLQRLLPTSNVDVIITSTDRAFIELGTPVDVDHYLRSESIEFLLERTQLADRAGADAVADHLGDHPLAIAAAAYIIGQPRNRSFQKYLDLLSTEPLATSLERSTFDPHPAAVFEAISLAVGALIDADRTGQLATILRVVSVLSPDGVARTLLHRLDAEPSQVDAAIDIATRACLLNCSLDGQVLTLHRLTARTIREHHLDDPRTAADTSRTSFEIVRADLDLAVVTSGHQETVRTAVGHLEALSAAPSDTRTTALVLTWRSRGARILSALGRNLPESIGMAQDAAADCERILGADHPGTLSSRNNLASVYQDAGQLDKAIPLHQDTLRDRERVLGTDHPRTLDSRNNLAYAYKRAGQLDKAIPLYEDTLRDSERIFGTDHPSTLTTRNNLASAYQEAGQLDKAIPLHQETLRDRERILAPDHPDILTSRHNLANTYRIAGQLDEAITLHRDALRDRERILGTDHPDTLSSRNNLARTYRKAGQLDKAITLYQDTLRDRERILGTDHPDTLTNRNNLAYTYRMAGQLDKAITLYQDTLVDCERVFGPDHKMTRTIADNLRIARRIASQ